MVKPMGKKRVEELIQSVIDQGGSVTDIERAIGFLIIGNTFGWQVLRLTHSYCTYRKFEGLLGIVARDSFPARTEESDRVRAIRLADAMGKWWQGMGSPKINLSDAVVDC